MYVTIILQEIFIKVYFFVSIDGLCTKTPNTGYSRLINWSFITVSPQLISLRKPCL